MHKVIHLVNDAQHGILLTIEDAPVAHFPNTPENKNRDVAVDRMYGMFVETKFQKNTKSAIHRRRQTEVLTETKESPFRKGAFEEYVMD